MGLSSFYGRTFEAVLTAAFPEAQGRRYELLRGAALWRVH